MTTAPQSPSRRLLVVMPTWVGDAVMATPTIRVLRERLPGAFLGALVRPPIDQVIAGTSFFDEIHVDRRAGVMGPKKAAAKIRPRQYDTALMLTNSFSSALSARLAFVPRRIGYDRDGRGMLLTDRLFPPKRRESPPYSESDTNPDAWAPIDACSYYLNLARLLLDDPALKLGPLELGATAMDEDEADAILARAGLDVADPGCVILNPGGNNPEKRWPIDRFSLVAHHLMRTRGLNVLVNGAPGERQLTEDIASGARQMGDAHDGGPRCIALPRLGVTLGSLKALTSRARLMITNDTGPRHIAAAFSVPVVTLFGPTDHRWTEIPFEDEISLLADPDLPEREVANDHPDRCRVDQISTEQVIEAAEALLTRR